MTKNNALPPASQPWVRELEKRIKDLENKSYRTDSKVNVMSNRVMSPKVDLDALSVTEIRVGGDEPQVFEHEVQNYSINGNTITASTPPVPVQRGFIMEWEVDVTASVDYIQVSSSLDPEMYEDPEEPTGALAGEETTYFADASYMTEEVDADDEMFNPVPPIVSFTLHNPANTAFTFTVHAVRMRFIIPGEGGLRITQGGEIYIEDGAGHDRIIQEISEEQAQAIIETADNLKQAQQDLEAARAEAEENFGTLDDKLGQAFPGDNIFDVDLAIEQAKELAEQQFNDSITGTLVEYSRNSNETNPPITGWSTTPPTRTPGTFIWMRTTVSYGSGDTTTTDPVLLTGNTGAQGPQGPEGPQGPQGVRGPDGPQGQALYTWIKYAPNGNPTSGEMSESPVGMTYMGIAHNQTTQTEGTDPTAYSWSLIKGPQGDTGIPGPDGADGQSLYTWVKYAPNGSPTASQITDTPQATSTHIGLAYNKTTASETTVPSDYTWSLIKGPKGDKGEKGDTGADGLPGATGVGISSTEISYVRSENGSVAPDHNAGWNAQPPTPIKGQFLWTRTKWNYTDGSSEYGYSSAYWAEDGAKGTDGLAGKDGTKLTGTVNEYAQSTSGTVPPTSGWASQPPTPVAGRYMWTRTTWTYSDASTEYGYSVGKIGDTGARGEQGERGPIGIQGPQGPKGDKGDSGSDGLPGAAGKGIKSTDISYARSTSGTTAPASGWQSQPPSPIKGQYLWTRTIWTYTDNATETGYSSAYWAQDGAKGNDGAAGKDGTKLTGTVQHYAQSTSGTTPPTSGWATQPPTAVPGMYMWTRSTWTYSDASTEYGYTVGKIGDTGPQGPQGVPGTKGADGTQYYTWLKYAPNGNPTSAQMTDVPNSNSTHMGIALNQTSPTEGTNPSSYTWSLIKGTDGVKGDPGADGKSLYTWIKYAPNGSPTDSQITDLPQSNSTHIGLAYNKTTATESTSASAYTWTLIQGPKGDEGAEGDKGDQGVSVSSITPHFRRLADSVAKPAKPTGMTPSGWVAVEPDYARDTTMWRSDRIVFSNNQITWTDVSKSSSYEAAKAAESAALLYADQKKQEAIDAGAHDLANLQIGGRNYMLNSAQQMGLFFISSNNNTTSPMQRGTDEIGQWITGTSASSGHFYLSTYTNPTFEAGRGSAFSDGFFPVPDVYTQSIEVMSEVSMAVRLSSSGADTLIQPNEWTQIYRTYTPSDTSGSRSRLWGPTVTAHPDVPVGTKLYIRNWKLEKGNKATSWTPAPEDVDAGIADAQEAADSAYSFAVDVEDIALNASTQATTAMTTADGKNAVSYTDVADSVAEPGPTPATSLGSGRPKYDMHRNRRSSNGVVIGEWIWTGTAWTRLQLSDAMLSSLDVGKLTAGTANIETGVINKLWGQLGVFDKLDVRQDAYVSGINLKDGAVTARTLNVVPEEGTGGVEILPPGVRIIPSDEANGTTVSLRVDEDSILSFAQGGDSKFSVNQDGRLSAQEVSANDSLIYRGDEVSDLLKAFPRGVIAHSTGENMGSAVPGTDEGRIGAVTFRTPPDDRMVEVRFRGYIASASARDVDIRIRQSTGTTVIPANSSKRFWRLSTNGATPVEVSALMRTDSSGWGWPKDATITVGLFAKSVNAGQSVTFHSNGGNEMTVTDTGPAIDVQSHRPWVPSTGGGSGGGTETETGKRDYTYQSKSSWVRSFLGTNAFYNYGAGRAYQGLQPGTSNGNLKSMIGWPSLISTLGEANIKSIKIRIKNNHSYAYSGVTAYIGLHGRTSAPSTWAHSVGDVITASFTRGQTRTLTVPSQYHAGFKNGDYTGISLYSSLSSNSRYGYWDGTNAELIIEYEK